MHNGRQAEATPNKEIVLLAFIQVDNDGQVYSSVKLIHWTVGRKRKIHYKCHISREIFADPHKNIFDMSDPN